MARASPGRTIQGGQSYADDGSSRGEHHVSESKVRASLTQTLKNQLRQMVMMESQMHLCFFHLDADRKQPSRNRGTREAGCDPDEDENKDYSKDEPVQDGSPPF